MASNPLDQFRIERTVPLEAGGVDISFTNSATFMVLAVAVITIFMLLGSRQRALVPGRWQSMVEMSYEMVAGMIRDTVGPEAKRYFPFVFTLFMFVLVCNLLGMVPYSFTATSHIIVTFALAGFIFVGVTIIGFLQHGLGYLKLFAPEGATPVLLAILIPIEIISYFIRPISLSVRLFANMMAGHTMLKVFAGFVVSLGAFGIFPFAFMIALTGLEVIIAILQAYIFAILSCIYLNDAIHLH
ncbi:MAG: F0F1 ATP synthase subunit A [Alphaproteobacteria bacterium]